MTGAVRIARRAFVFGAVAVAGGALFGTWRYLTPYDNPLLGTLGPDEAALTPYVKVSAAGITLITPRAEMGQGIHTTLAALVAEELDVTLDAVRVEHGPASVAYLNAGAMLEFLPFGRSPTCPPSSSVTRSPAARHLCTTPSTRCAVPAPPHARR
jgi:isoquinoline 1-oxidoreductase subunit beta